MSTPLSIRDAAASAGVTEKTIRRWIQSGRLKADKLGGQYQIDVVALDAARVDMPPVQVSKDASTHETPPVSAVQTARVDTGQTAVSSPSIDLQPFADVIERQGAEIRRLTEASTIWQFRAMQAEERLKQLTAGPEVADPDEDEDDRDEAKARLEREAIRFAARSRDDWNQNPRNRRRATTLPQDRRQPRA